MARPGVEYAGPDEALSALNSYRVEGRLDFASGGLEVRDYSWNHDTADIWSIDQYFFHVCLSPRSNRPRAAYLDCDGRVATEVGRLMLVPPGRRVSSGGVTGRQRSLHCNLAPHLIDDVLGHAPVWRDAALAEGLCLRSPDVENLLLRMYHEARAPGFAAAVMAESLAQALAIAVIRKFRLDSTEPAPVRGGLAPWRLRLVRDRVLADGAPPSLTELAQLCRLSTRHLSRGFKAETGTTVLAFINQVQIDRARTLLTQTDLPVADIARQLGFASSSSFSHAFRRETGMLPHALRADAGRPVLN